jgi:hypothetical protein
MWCTWREGVAPEGDLQRGQTEHGQVGRVGIWQGNNNATILVVYVWQEDVSREYNIDMKRERVIAAE